MISIVELRKKDLSALNKDLRVAEFALWKIKILVSTWKEKAIHKLHEAKKHIAQLKTVLNEKLQNKS